MKKAHAVVGELAGLHDPTESGERALGLIARKVRRPTELGLRYRSAIHLNAAAGAWIDQFADYGARIEIVYIEPPLPVVLARNARRTNPVPERVVLRLAEKLEPPTPAEAHDVVLTDGAVAR